MNRNRSPSDKKLNLRKTRIFTVYVDIEKFQILTKTKNIIIN